MKTVYLAGPIAGCSYERATSWRDDAVADLAKDGIKGLSPMRAKEHLKPPEHPYPVGTRVLAFGVDNGRVEEVKQYSKTGYAYAVALDGGRQVLVNNSAVRAIAPDDVGFSATCEGYAELSVLSSARGIMTRDRFDATRCDVLLVNLLGATEVSVGTVMEIAWADRRRTPIVVAMEKTGNPHEHAMIGEAIGFRCSTLEEALHVTRSILA